MSIKKIIIEAFCLTLSSAGILFSQPLLTDQDSTYKYKNENFKCGLYEGTNTMPSAHLTDGMAIAQSMRSMSKITICVIGHSVPYTTFNGWDWSSAKSTYKLAANTNFVCGAVSAKMAWDWINEFNGSYKSIGGLAAGDINVLVVQLTWAPFGGPDNYEMNTALSIKRDSMAHDLGRLAQNAKKNLPNLKMILFEADPWQNAHEPYHAYHEWYFNRQVVLNQINGDTHIDLSYKGDNPKTVWLGLGGYWWQNKSPGASYYSDCCHLTSAGATYYRDLWVKSLLTDPVVSEFLLAAPPTGTFENTLKPVSPEMTLNCLNSDQGIEVVFSLFNPARVSLGVFTTNGQAIIPMFDKFYAAGKNTAYLKTDKPLTPGSYIVKIGDGKSVKQRLMTIIREP